MKNILKALVLVLITGSLFSCKKQLEQLTLLGGNAPVLTASVTGSIPLAYANENSEAVKLMWNNPDYKFSNGVSSQDVSYNLEIDTVGANFSSPKKKMISVKNNLSQSFTQKELNLILLNDMELTIGTTYNLQVRITSSLSTNGAAPLTSNTLTFAAKPYQDPTLLPPDLFITGDATGAGWTNSPPDDQKFTYKGSKKYELTIAFVPGKQYKFLSQKGQWQPQYGSSSSTGGALQVNDGTTSDPPAINTPAEAGNYKITVDMSALTYEIVKL